MSRLLSATNLLFTGAGVGAKSRRERTMYTTTDLRISRHHREQLLDEARQDGLARALRRTRRQAEEQGTPLMVRRIPRLWVQLRQVAFGR